MQEALQLCFDRGDKLNRTLFVDDIYDRYMVKHMIKRFLKGIYIEQTRKYLPCNNFALVHQILHLCTSMIHSADCRQAKEVNKMYTGKKLLVFLWWRILTCL